MALGLGFRVFGGFFLGYGFWVNGFIKVFRV